MGEDLSITVIATGFDEAGSAVQPTRSPTLSSVKGWAADADRTA